MSNVTCPVQSLICSVFHQPALFAVVKRFQSIAASHAQQDECEQSIEQKKFLICCNQIKVLSLRCLLQVTTGLISWRENAVQQASKYLVENCDFTPAEICQNRDEIQCAVNVIWAEAVYNALNHYDGNNLEDNVCLRIEDICSEHICRHVNCLVSPFGRLLGILSTHRMLSIASRLTAAVRAFPHGAERLGVRTSSAFGFLRLSLLTPALSRASTQCLRLSLELTQRNLCKCLGPDLKHTICEALVSAVTNLEQGTFADAEQSNSLRNIDADAWVAVLELARSSVAGWALRPKHRDSAYPLLAALAVAVESDTDADARVCTFIREIIIDGGALAPPKTTAAVIAAAGLSRAKDLRSSGTQCLRILANSIRRRNATETAESRRALAAIVRSHAPTLASKADLTDEAIAALAHILAIGVEHFDAWLAEGDCNHKNGSAGDRPWFECILQLLRSSDERQVRSSFAKQIC